jgi:Domain of unknown function (DUF4388)
MGISGSLQDFSLPEILQIIDNGSKSGRLSINSSLKGQSLNNQGTNYLWFQNGNFVALSNSLQHNSLLNLIKRENFLASKNLVKLYGIERSLNTSMGDYCLQNALLNFNQINQLFEQQLETVYSLFELENGWFIFEDADNNNQVSEKKEDFPLIEMTGQKLEALTILLQAMRSLKKLDARLMEQMPDPNSGLIKLTERLHFKLLPIEACLFEDANGQSSFKKIAQKTLFAIKDLQEAALRLVLIGLVEEVPVTGSTLQGYVSTSSETNTVNSKVKNQVSNSFFSNLVSFLRNNF